MGVFWDIWGGGRFVPFWMGFRALWFYLPILDIRGVMDGFGWVSDGCTSVLVHLDPHRTSKTAGLTQKKCQNIFVMVFLSFGITFFSRPAMIFMVVREAFWSKLPVPRRQCSQMGTQIYPFRSVPDENETHG